MGRIVSTAEKALLASFSTIILTLALKIKLLWTLPTSKISVCCGVYIKKKTLIHWGWKCQMVQPFWKRAWTFLKKLETNLPYYLAILFLVIYPTVPQTLLKIIYFHFYIHSSTIYIAQIWKQNFKEQMME